MAHGRFELREDMQGGQRSQPRELRVSGVRTIPTPTGDDGSASCSDPVGR